VRRPSFDDIGPLSALSVATLYNAELLSRQVSVRRLSSVTALFTVSLCFLRTNLHDDSSDAAQAQQDSVNK